MANIHLPIRSIFSPRALRPVILCPGRGGAFECHAGGHLVGGVVLEHIEDEALLDGLLHRVQVKRLQLLGDRVTPAEQLQGLRLRGGGEREVAQALVRVTVGRHRRQGILVSSWFLQVELLGVLGEVEHLPDGLRRTSRLGGVSFIGDDREPLPRQLLLVRRVLQRRQGIGEGLQGHSDDLCRPAGEYLRQPGGFRPTARFDGLEGPGDGLQLVDCVLKLTVKDLPVSDDEDGVKDLLAGLIVEGCQAVGGPSNRVGLA